MAGETKLPDASDLDRGQQELEVDQEQQPAFIEEIKQTDPKIALLKKQEIENIVN